MIWDDIQVNTKFDNGIIIERHVTHNEPCYEFVMKEGKLVVSEEHYILCNVKKVRQKYLDYVLEQQGGKVPKKIDGHLYGDHGYAEVVEYDDAKIDRNTYWLTAKSIAYLMSCQQKVKPIGAKFKSYKFVGLKPVFCVSTDTGRYKVCGVISHNSVGLRNLIIHSLTHKDIALALVDPKRSEFSYWKGKKGVVGVANTVQETAELLRLARSVMYARNESNEKNRISDWKDYKPTKPTDQIEIFGSLFNENDMIDVEIDGQQKQITAKELLNMVTEK